MPAFHEILFPTKIALGSRGGPQRLTDVVTLGSGREERNQRWQHSRRRYNAGFGVKTLEEIAEVTAFFEERRGRLFGFRWRDHSDFSSATPHQSVTPYNQQIGIGNAVQTQFQLVKKYGSVHAPYSRHIGKPVEGTVRVAVDNVEVPSANFSVDVATGLVSVQSPPAPGAIVSAGFLFDVPVRFDTDYLEMDLAAFDAGEIPNIPIVEIIV